MDHSDIEDQKSRTALPAKLPSFPPIPEAFDQPDWRTPGLLDAFAAWYLANLGKGLLPVRTLFHNVGHFGPHATVLLFRSGPLQVQLVVSRAGVEIPDHVHPNVDSYEVFFGGPIYFRKDGNYITTPRNNRCLPDGSSSAWGWHVAVPSTASHGGRTGKAQGASFLSIQLWKNGVLPTSVEQDWDGERLGEDHQVTTTSSVVD